MIRRRGGKMQMRLQREECQRRTALGCAALLAVCLVSIAAPPVRGEIHEDALFEMSFGAGLSTPSGDLSEYKFLDELRKMGYSESLALYIKQERR